VISRATAEHYVWGDGCAGWHLVQGEALSVIHERMPPGKRETQHYHERARQFFFILAGAAVLEVEGRPEALQAGQGLEVPPGARHHIRNEGAAPVEFLVISQPTTRGDRIDVA
jgi:mannose-6-phosphate isomerase-like protein (cupin superfamily)